MRNPGHKGGGSREYLHKASRWQNPGGPLSELELRCWEIIAAHPGSTLRSYRLRAAPLTVPSPREKRSWYLRFRNLARPVPQFAAEAVHLLRHRRWAGDFPTLGRQTFSARWSRAVRNTTALLFL